MWNLKHKEGNMTLNPEGALILKMFLCFIIYSFVKMKNKFDSQFLYDVLVWYLLILKNVYCLFYIMSIFCSWYLHI